MEERLKELLAQERLTPARFAELVGVQRSSVSHIISGRNKPSLDFLQKTLSTLGHISPDWLISGTGPYKRTDVSSKTPDPPQTAKRTINQEGRLEFPSARPSTKEEDPAVYGTKAQQETSSVNKNSSITTSNSEKEANPDALITSDTGILPKDTGDSESLKSESREKKIIKTILFYDDHSFEVFYPH
jgi:transcriptional regulator with XRE-family HTH domain